MDSFDQLPLSAPLARAITELGYTTPSPIQAQTLPILLGEPTDFMGLAATGTGKTAAFAIPLLEKIKSTQKNVQGIILCPTRELALQVAGQIELLGKFMNIRALPIYGGAPYGDQIRGLKDGAQIVVGTPGRIVDHITRGVLKLDGLHTVILDEADEMISMGFKEDLETILQAVPMEKSRIWLFSATMSPGVRKVANEYLREAKNVQVNRTEVVPTRIEQFYYFTRESNKPEILCKLIDSVEDFYGLIFCQTKAMVTDLTTYLVERGYPVDCLHGDMNQKARENTMAGFRSRRIKVLICTDVASRGLDVKDITHVINYSLPRELENYVHRIGRTARSGKSGVAMSLVTPSHQRLISQIERITKSRMLEGKIPTRKDIGTRKLNSFLSKFQAQTEFPKALELMSDTWREALASMTPEEVAARFLTLEMPDVFRMTDLPEMPKPREVQREQETRRGGFRSSSAGRDSFRSQLPRRPREDARGSGERSFSRGGPPRGDSRSGERPRSSTPYAARSEDRPRSSAPYAARTEERGADRPFRKERTEERPSGGDRPFRRDAGGERPKSFGASSTRAPDRAPRLRRSDGTTAAKPGEAKKASPRFERGRHA